MKVGDLVKHREGGNDLALVLEVAPFPTGAAVRILLNDGRRIWVGASMLEIVNATG